MDAFPRKLDGPSRSWPAGSGAPLRWEQGRGEAPAVGSEAEGPALGIDSGGGGTSAGAGSGTRCDVLKGGAFNGRGLAGSAPLSREVLCLPVMGEEREVAALWLLTSLLGRQHTHR